MAARVAVDPLRFWRTRSRSQPAEEPQLALCWYGVRSAPASATRGGGEDAEQGSGDWFSRAEFGALQGEIMTMLASLRRNSRFRLQAGTLHKESPLVSGLTQLAAEIIRMPAMPIRTSKVDANSALKPFLRIIESEEASGPTTSAALHAVERLLAQGFVHPGMRRAARAMDSVCHAAMHCRFEETDAESDEVIYMRIVTLLRTALCSPAGGLVCDERIEATVKYVFTMAHEVRRSQQLRKQAELVVLEVVRRCFARLRVVDADPTAGSEADEFVVLTHESGMRQPHGLQAAEAVLRFLVPLVRFQNTDSAEVTMGFELLNTAMSAAGTSMARFPCLMEEVQRDVSLTLIQRSANDDLTIYARVVRLTVSVVKTLRQGLRLQTQTLLQKVFLPVLLGKQFGDKLEHQEVAMHGLYELCSEPTFAVELYINYDCELSSPDLLLDVCTALASTAAPAKSGEMHYRSHLALEILSTIFTRMAEGCEGSATASNDENLARIADLSKQCRAQYVAKKELMIAVELFNDRPKKGLQMFADKGFVPTSLEPKAVADFLRSTPTLRKDKLGELFGEPEDCYLAILREWLDAFDFASLEFDAAIRVFLESFRLPGEAQKIDRIMEAFAKRYFTQRRSCFADEDAAFILAFSLIMLNTDTHSPQLKDRERMTLQQFLSNNRQINGGKDFPQEFMRPLYNSITKNEIKMSDDGDGSGMTSDIWDDLLRKSRLAAPIISVEVDQCCMFCYDVCRVAWQSCGDQLLDNFSRFPAGVYMEQAVECLRSTARCAYVQGQNSMVDSLIEQLYWMTPLAQKEPREGFVSALAKSRQLQIVINELFYIPREYGECLLAGWPLVLRCLAACERDELLPAEFFRQDALRYGSAEWLASDDTDDEHDEVQPTAIDVPQPGLWKSMSETVLAYTGLAARAAVALGSPEVRPVALRCIAEAFPQEMILRSSELSENSLLALVSSMVGEIRAVVTTEGPSATPVLVRSSSGSESNGAAPSGVEKLERLSDDDGAFYVDVLAEIAQRNETRIACVWPTVSHHLLDVILKLAPCGSRILKHSLSAYLRVGARQLFEHSSVKESLWVLFEGLADLPDDRLDPLLPILAVELHEIVRLGFAGIATGQDTSSESGPQVWRDIFRLMERTAALPAESRDAHQQRAAAHAFAALQFVVLEVQHAVHDDVISSNSFSDCVSAVLAFAEPAVADTPASAPAADGNATRSRLGTTSSDLSTVGHRRSIQSLDLLFMLGTIEIGRGDERGAGVSIDKSLLHGLSVMSCDVREEVRSHALSLLQTALGQHGLNEHVDLFRPLIDDHLAQAAAAAEAGRTDAHAGWVRSLTRVTCVISKTFVSLAPTLAEAHTDLAADTEFELMWLQLLDLLEKAHRGCVSDAARQAEVLQSLQKMVGALKAAGVIALVSAEPGSQQHSAASAQLYNTTEKILQRFASPAASIAQPETQHGDADREVDMSSRRQFVDQMPEPEPAEPTEDRLQAQVEQAQTELTPATTHKLTPLGTAWAAAASEDMSRRTVRQSSGISTMVLRRGSEGFGMAIGMAKEGKVCVERINSETSPAALAGVTAGWLVKAVAGTLVGSKAEVVAALQALGDDATEVEFVFADPAMVS